MCIPQALARARYALFSRKSPRIGPSRTWATMDLTIYPGTRVQARVGARARTNHARPEEVEHLQNAQEHKEEHAVRDAVVRLAGAHHQAARARMCRRGIARARAPYNTGRMMMVGYT